MRNRIDRGPTGFTRQVRDKSDPEFVLVKKFQDLCRLSANLEKEAAIGVDLEADSMYHYREKVCLVQISTASRNFLIDPVSLGDLSPLLPVFSHPNIRKVFHGSDYDIRSLHRDFGIEVHCLFDTQIAARFLGFGETSLAGLIMDKFGVLIKKKYQKKDWSMRPLPQAMLSYAAQDACYLLPLADFLEKELRSRGWLSCLEEECDILSRVRQTPPADGPLFLRFKGAGRLESGGLAVLEAVLRLRVELASRWDRPLFKVLGNRAIMDIANKKPVTEKGLADIEGLSPKQIKTLGPDLLENISAAMNLPEGALPVYPAKVRQTLRTKNREKIKALKKWRDRRAGELGIDPALICPNALIENLVQAHPGEPKDLEDIDGMRTWQRQHFGQEICALLDLQAS